MWAGQYIRRAATGIAAVALALSAVGTVLGNISTKEILPQVFYERYTPSSLEKKIKEQSILESRPLQDTQSLTGEGIFDRGIVVDVSPMEVVRYGLIRNNIRLESPLREESSQEAAGVLQAGNSLRDIDFAYISLDEISEFVTFDYTMPNPNVPVKVIEPKWEVTEADGELGFLFKTAECRDIEKHLSKIANEEPSMGTHQVVTAFLYDGKEVSTPAERNKLIENACHGLYQVMHNYAIREAQNRGAKIVILLPGDLVMGRLHHTPPAEDAAPFVKRMSEIEIMLLSTRWEFYGDTRCSDAPPNAQTPNTQTIKTNPTGQ